VLILDSGDPGELFENERWANVDICDALAVAEALRGVNAILHLAGFPNERSIEEILRVNVLGTHNIYEAARALGIKRVILGSSNHVTGFYPRNQRVSPEWLMRPDSFYGLSKCWNELEAGLYYEKYGIRTLIIRIANATMAPEDPRSDHRSRATWVSPRDLAQLVLIGITHSDIDCTTVYGVSQTDINWWDNSKATTLGYSPQDRGYDHSATFPTPPRPDSQNQHVADRFQGGRFCAADHDGVLRMRNLGVLTE
jgi:uronate dehydrogenase